MLHIAVTVTLEIENEKELVSMRSNQERMLWQIIMQQLLSQKYCMIAKNPQDNAYQFSMFKLDGLYTEIPKIILISISITELKHYLGHYCYPNVSTDISTVFYIQLLAYKTTI